MTRQFVLDHLSCLDLEGSDAHAFAQAQFTANIDDMPSDQWSPLAWSDPKGRVLAFMLAAKSQQRVELLLPRSQAESMAGKLRLYTIGRKLEISAPKAVSGAFGPHGLNRPLSTDPNRSMAVSTGAETSILDVTRWQHLDICQGLPWLEPESSGRFLPQWLGLEQLGALSYSKGCYPGQEVIARVHYLGTVKYGLRGLKIHQASQVKAHARIIDSAGKALGHCLRVVSVKAGGVGLAVLPAGLDDGAEIRLETATGPCPAQMTPIAALC